MAANVKVKKAKSPSLWKQKKLGGNFEKKKGPSTPALKPVKATFSRSQKRLKQRASLGRIFRKRQGIGSNFN